MQIKAWGALITNKLITKPYFTKRNGEWLVCVPNNTDTIPGTKLLIERKDKVIKTVILNMCIDENNQYSLWSFSEPNKLRRSYSMNYIGEYDDEEIDFYGDVLPHGQDW
jgi:hypothetical protein